MTSRALALLLATLALPHALAAPPRVVSVAPASGELAVDPATALLRIEFDQDMDPKSGYSLCGGGPEFPRLTGPGRWESSRVCVFPVQLVAGQAYRFSINCTSAQRFRSVAGEPAEALPVSFRTRSAAALDRATNRAALERLRVAVETRYSHRDRLGADWLTQLEAALSTLTETTTPHAFAEAAAALLAPARDAHLFFRVGPTTVPSFRFELKPNADAARLPALIPEWRRRNAAVGSGRFPDGIGYILIDTWQGAPELFAAAHEAAAEFARAPGIVLDVRFNAGGDELQARAFARHFTRERRPYARHRVRSPEHAEGWTPWQAREVEAAAAPFAGRVAVLMGPRCFSSNESFLLMMRDAAGSRLFGEPSFGSSGNPQPHPLGNGVTVLLPSWQEEDVQGRPIEGRGVTPDAPVRFDPDAPGDTVLAAALAWLRG